MMIFLGLSILISSAYAMRTIGMLFTGPIKPQMREIEDLRTPEFLAASLLVGGILVFGLWPSVLVDLSVATMQQMSDIISQRIQ